MLGSAIKAQFIQQTAGSSFIILMPRPRHQPELICWGDAVSPQDFLSAMIIWFKRQTRALSYHNTNWELSPRVPLQPNHLINSWCCTYVVQILSTTSNNRVTKTIRGRRRAVTSLVCVRTGGSVARHSPSVCLSALISSSSCQPSNNSVQRPDNRNNNNNKNHFRFTVGRQATHK